MNTKNANYSFTVRTVGDERIFTYKKAKLGLKTYIPMLWPGLLLGIFLAYQKAASSELHFTPTEKLSAGLFYGVIYTLTIPALAVIVMNLLRRPGTFSLEPDGIFLNGSLYPYSDIASVYIKSPQGQIMNQRSQGAGFIFAFGGDRVQSIGLGAASTVAAATSGLVMAGGQLSHAAGKGIVNSVRTKSYKICFLFGNKEITMASGMTEIESGHLLNAITNQQ